MSQLEVVNSNRFPEQRWINSRFVVSCNKIVGTVGGNLPKIDYCAHGRAFLFRALSPLFKNWRWWGLRLFIGKRYGKRMKADMIGPIRDAGEWRLSCRN